MNGYSLDESEVDEDTAAFSVIKFGDLFKMYTRISDKVVGLLLRAKKYRLVFFEPEMLFQGKFKSFFDLMFDDLHTFSTFSTLTYIMLQILTR